MYQWVMGSHQAGGANTSAGVCRHDGPSRSSPVVCMVINVENVFRYASCGADPR